MRILSRVGIALFAAVVMATLTTADKSSAGTFSNPCAFGAASCGGSSGPYHPLGTVIKDTSGNLYGTVGWGGLQSNAGAVFEITSGGTYIELYDFCSRTACGDGETPSGSLIVDVNGALYGTTQTGGKGDGVVYRLIPPVSGTAWTYDVLYKFCYSGSTAPCPGGTAEGRKPAAGLAYAGQASGMLYDGVSPLYGTTIFGGNTSNDGTVFSLTPGTSGAWTRKTLYKFDWDSIAHTGGYAPGTNLVMDASGDLFGTAGGGRGDGIIYEISPSGTHWTETDLYYFCTASLISCTDGRTPDQNGLAIDSVGNLWGTTVAGGNFNYLTADGGGTLYEAYLPDGVCTPSPTWCLRVAYAFCSQPSCTDGYSPSYGNGPIIASESPYTIWGTTTDGGANGFGTLYKLRGSIYGTRHDFCGGTCGDGNNATGGLYQDSAGSFYGATTGGGLGYGTIFEYVP